MSSREQSERMGWIKALQSYKGVKSWGMGTTKILRCLVVTGDKRDAGCDRIIMMVFQSKVGNRPHPTPLLQPGPLGGM